MKKLLIKILVTLFGSLFAVTLFLSIITMYSLTTKMEASSEEAFSEQTPLYHFAVFLPDNSYSFFNQLKKGITAASNRENCAISFHSVQEDDLDFQMAEFSGVDGVIVYPNLDEAENRSILERLNKAGIPIVLVEHRLSDDSPWSFVGTNNFELGKEIGNLVSKTVRGPIEMALVYSEKSPGIYNERELVEMGITTTLGERIASTLSVKKTDLNPLTGEEVTYNILREEPWINTLVFTDANDTLAAAQVIIDMNLVGTVQVIGFGDDPTILEYISKGVLTGTITVDPVQIGDKAVQLLLEQNNKGYSPTYVDTGVFAISQANSADWEKEISE